MLDPALDLDEALRRVEVWDDAALRRQEGAGVEWTPLLSPSGALCCCSDVSCCDLWGRKINFTTSKTLVGWSVFATDRNARVPLDLPHCKEPLKKWNETQAKNKQENTMKRNAVKKHGKMKKHGKNKSKSKKNQQKRKKEKKKPPFF